MKSGSVVKQRVSGFAVFMVVAFVAAGASQARVNIFERNAILKRAESTDRFTVSRVEYAKRGQIFTADGKPLAQDVDARELTVDFNKVPHSASFYMDLSSATGIPASDFKQFADNNVRTRVWRDPVGSEQAKRIQAVKTFWRADGVSLSRSGRRSYPMGSSAAGFVGSFRDGMPLTGLELSKDKVLSGENGLQRGLIDRGGSFLPMRLAEASTPRVDGKNLTLTIDSDLQAAAAAAIKRAVDSNKADQGSAIVMDPKTGDILAMANWPSYDPNQPWGPVETNGKSPDFNAAYMAALEPGSTFKILTVAKALEMGVVGVGEHFYCKGGIQVRNKVLKCDLHHGSRAHGDLDPQLAIAKSCNVCAATWALRIGYEPMVDYLRKLGLLEKTTLGLPREGTPQFNFDEYAKNLQLATVGFGQSLGSTPVALCGAFSMLANNGLRMKPRLIRAIGDQELPPVEGAQVVSSKTAEIVRGFMESVIESDAGTGKTLRIPGYSLAGKTGTAQKVNSSREGGYVSNFVGFVPAQKPRAVILVMVDHPKAGKYYGASVAGPVFVDLAHSVIRRFGIAPDSPGAAAGAAASR